MSWLKLICLLRITCPTRFVPYYFIWVQVRLQQPHYYGTPLCGTQYSSTASYKQQQQSFWAVQLAANGGSSAVNCNIVRAQYPNWQSGRVESCAVSPFAQVISSISQQKPFPLASSLHPSRTIGLDIHLPSVCEESKGRFRSSGTPSLQLLCDERLWNWTQISIFWFIRHTKIFY